ncbi:amidohydrolase [Biomphalaria pfeifferi]|uniref:Amidohydrolase n=1 Tax=Biomphalaria pfeifferi TaxID=112525 RepID=A0AAD8ANG2_BIOPF|nr:amidohydrolase [Biomphalaria pfeifferi]
MKRTKTALVLLSFLILASASAFSVKAQVAVQGETIWTMAGENITNGVILIGANGKIEAVGTAAQVKIPSNYKVVTAKVVTPGLIDAHTVIGLNGYLNQPHDQMAVDGSAPIQPELRAIDAYNAEEKLIEWVRQFGRDDDSHWTFAAIVGFGADDDRQNFRQEC